VKKMLLFATIFSILLLSYQALSYAINGHIGDKTAIISPVPEPVNIFLLGFGMFGVGIMLRKRVLKSKDK
jgi:hypothetical protein